MNAEGKSNPFAWLAGPRPLFLHNLRIPPGLGVLVLAPHPDDFDAVGITMRRLQANGNPINVVVVSSGGAGVEDGFCRGSPTVASKRAIRVAEQKASCAFFGLPEARLAFLTLQEDAAGNLVESPANFEIVRDRFQAIDPDLVFLPSGNDHNNDHRQVYAMYARLADRAGRPLIGFLNEDPKTLTLRRDLYTIFGPQEAAWKAELLRCHRSQDERNRHSRGHGFDERILAVNRRTAQLAGLPEEYAEAFELEVRE